MIQNRGRFFFLNNFQAKLILLSFFFFLIIIMTFILFFARRKYNYFYSINDSHDIQVNQRLIGKIINDISFKDLSGRNWSINSFQSLFKIIVIFNTNDCPSCMQELLLWKKIYQTFNPEEIFLVAIVHNSTKKQIRSFLQKKDISFLVLIDDKDRMRKYLNLNSSPWRILINRENRIVDIQRPSAELSKQNQFLNKLFLLLNGNPINN